MEGPQPAGDWLIVSSILLDEVPLNDPVNSYQFGFVFDRDNVSTNNYQALPQFANDFYQDTDLWYSVEYTPAGGWVVNVTDARTSKGLAAMASGARAIIDGNAIVLLVPAGEFDVADPGFRQTAFRHSGDFGQNPPFDYSVDYSPEIDTPLRKADALLDLPGPEEPENGCSSLAGSSAGARGGDYIVILLLVAALIGVSRNMSARA